MSNYQNRRKRGQCASCTKQAEPNAVRCGECQIKHRQQYAENSEAFNARRRERAFERAMSRERRLETLDILLQAEVAELEKEFTRRIGSIMEKSE
jgi:hypothetical protein